MYFRGFLALGWPSPRPLVRTPLAPTAGEGKPGLGLKNSFFVRVPAGGWCGLRGSWLITKSALAFLARRGADRAPPRGLVGAAGWLDWLAELRGDHAQRVLGGAGQQPGQGGGMPQVHTTGVVRKWPAHGE